jgi:D-cysteine desulfhydrase
MYIPAMSSPNTPLLFQKYPEASSLPHIPLATLPTPVEPLTLLPNTWIKRDDLTSPVYGGNKVRKLEFILAHARSRGARRLITAGAAGSHHALATTIYGRQLGFEVTLILFPQPLTDHVQQVLLADHALGAELRFTPRMTMVPPALTAARFLYWRERVHVIAPGGSDPYGTIGYINAALELGGQIQRGEVPEPELIVVAAGTMGTAAGLAIGLTMLGARTRVVGTRITSRLVANELGLNRLIRDTCALLARHGVAVNAAVAGDRVRLSHDQVGTGYGRTTPAADTAIESFARIGIELDVSYTAKAAADLVQLRAGQPNAPILFWHTLSASVPQVAPGSQPLPPSFQSYLQSAR